MIVVIVVVVDCALDESMSAEESAIAVNSAGIHVVE